MLCGALTARCMSGYKKWTSVIDTGDGERRSRINPECRQGCHLLLHWYRTIPLAYHAIPNMSFYKRPSGNNPVLLAQNAKR
jgi:hypothetical protein